MSFDMNKDCICNPALSSFQ